MAAALALPIPSRRPTPPASTRPPLRLIPGGAGPDARRRRAVYRRRRIGAAVLALVVLAGLSAGVQTVSSLGDGPTDSSAGPTVASAPIAGAGTYVVQPGDTLWSIASALPADGDVREVVAELADRSGGAALRPGQQISLDGLVD